MGPIDINGWEIIVLAVLAVFILGPERLPEYAAKLGRLVRRGRALADGARAQLKEQLGPDFDDVDWAAYDPRQYDPRRIVREALTAPADPAEPGKPVSTGGPTDVASPTAGSGSATDPGRTDGWSVAAPADRVDPAGMPTPAEHDRSRPTPWDDEAT